MALTDRDFVDGDLLQLPQLRPAEPAFQRSGLVVGVAGLVSTARAADHTKDTTDSVKKALADDKPLLLDVRTPLEFANGHIPDAVNIPVDELRGRLAELPNDRPVVTYCQVGQRGYLATRILMQAGFAVSNLGGGYKTYLLHHPNQS